MDQVPPRLLELPHLRLNWLGSQPLLLPLLLLAAAPQPLDAGAAGPLSGVVERLQAVVGCTVGREGGGQRAGPG